MSTTKHPAAASPFAAFLPGPGTGATVAAAAKPAPSAKPACRQDKGTPFAHLRPVEDPYARFPQKGAPEPSFTDKLAAAKRKAGIA